METYITIDWLTLTTKLSGATTQFWAETAAGSARMTMTLFKALGVADPVVVADVPMAHYRYAFRDVNTGLKLQIGENRAIQGLLMVASGDTCNRLKHPANFLKKALDMDWHATRIDIAVDLFDTGWTPYGVFLDLQREYGEKLPRAMVVRKSRGRGDTVEIGSRQSVLHLRIYDKGKQQKTDRDWLRAELEMKGAAALQHAEEASRDLRPFAALMADMITDAAAGLTNKLAEIAGGRLAPHTEQPRKHTNRELWFRSQVLPAFLKWLEHDPTAARAWFDELAKKL